MVQVRPLKGIVIAKGTATITAGNEYVDVAHGLGYAPDIKKISLTSTNNLGGNSFWKSDVGAVTFRINVHSMPMFGDTYTFTYVIFS